MARYAVDLRDRVIRRVTQKYNGVDNERFFLIEAGSAKHGMGKGDSRNRQRSDSAECDCCPHRYCHFVKNVRFHNDTRTIGFVTVAGH